jgi:hypothetical protein
LTLAQLWSLALVCAGVALLARRSAAPGVERRP